jgi:basic amino acid/polyamine antiporter, APA family
MSAENQSIKEKKKIGLWICIALVIGNMIGSGIFLLPSSLAVYGGISMLGWLATAFGALMTALVFVRLSRRFPKQGGPYRYAYEQFGSFAGFSVAWSYWVSIWCGNAAIAVAGVTYLGFFWPELQQNATLSVIVTLSIVWTITLLNIKGVRQAGIFQLFTTILKFIPLAVIAAVSFIVFEPEAFKPFNLTEQPISQSIAATAALTLWAFLGLESATIPADNVNNPKQTIPRATIIGFCIVAMIYILTMLTIMSVVPNESLQQSVAPFADAAKIIWGEWASYIVAGAAVVSCLGALNGWILLQGQVPMSAARDGLLPEVFSDKNRLGVSTGGLVISSILISVLVLANFSEGMVSLFTFAILVSTLGIFIPYLLSIAADLKVLIKSEKSMAGTLSTITAVLALIYCCWAISGIGLKAMIWGGVLVMAGVPIYWLQYKKIKK